MSPSDGVTDLGGPGGFTAHGHKVPVCSAEQLRIRIDTDDGYTRVTVAGEIDYDDAELFRAALTRALGRRGDLFEVDLAGVPFCDCSGLNVLLDIRTRAEERGVTLILTRVGPVLLRLLNLTETLTLFNLVNPPAAPPASATRSAGPGRGGAGKRCGNASHAAQARAAQKESGC